MTDEEANNCSKYFLASLVNCKTEMFETLSKEYVKLEKQLQEQNRLVELGQLALKTQICYWGYDYADGDCQDGKCERNEFCKLRDEMLKGGKQYENRKR